MAFVLFLLVYSGAFMTLSASTLQQNRFQTANDHRCRPPTLPRSDTPGPFCNASKLPTPRPDLPEAEYYRALYYSFNCIVQEIIIPNVDCAGGEVVMGGGDMLSSGGMSSGVTRRRLSAGKRPGCSNVALYGYGSTEWERWRALAHRSFCLLEERLYETARGCCMFNESKGLYIKDSRVLAVRLKDIRTCPRGLVVCAVAKNEARYIQEWLAFHLVAGVEHFYIYLNDVEDRTLEALQPFIEVGLVSVHTMNGSQVQMPAYNHCLKMLKREGLAEWAAFIDLDEYLYLADHHSCLMDYLDTLKDRGGLTINWRMMSHSNNLLTLPMDKLLIEANHYTVADTSPLMTPVVQEFYHKHYKTIAKVELTTGVSNPHACSYQKGWVSKDEYGHHTRGGTNTKFQWPETRIRLHHYRERSVEDFLQKYFRGVACWEDHVYSFDAVVGDLRSSFTVLSATKPSLLRAFVKPVRHLLGLD